MGHDWETKFETENHKSLFYTIELNCIYMHPSFFKRKYIYKHHYIILYTDQYGSHIITLKLDMYMYRERSLHKIVNEHTNQRIN